MCPVGVERLKGVLVQEKGKGWDTNTLRNDPAHLDNSPLYTEAQLEGRLPKSNAHCGQPLNT